MPEGRQESVLDIILRRFPPYAQVIGIAEQRPIVILVELLEKRLFLRFQGTPAVSQHICLSLTVLSLNRLWPPVFSLYQLILHELGKK